MPSLHIVLTILNICERQCQTWPTCLPRTGHNGEHLYQVSSPAQLTNVSGYTISYTDIWSPTVGPPHSCRDGDQGQYNIDKIKCTFIACQSRKITRSMKIFKANFCLLLLSSFNDIIREQIQCNVNVSGNLPMLNNNVMK